MRGRKKAFEDAMEMLFPRMAEEELRESASRVLQRIYEAEPELARNFRFRPEIAIKAASLRRIDQVVLRALYLLRGASRALEVRQKVSDLAQKRILMGPVYSSLDRLARKDLVCGEWHPDDNGDLKLFFSVTNSGERALAELSAPETATEALEHFA